MSTSVRKFQPRQRNTSASAPAATATSVQQVFKGLVERNKNTIEFQLAPTKVEFANVLRRAIITEVESVAFRADIMTDGSTGDVQILKNSTPMSNEMIAHRVGLIPVHVSNPLEWNPEEYTFELNVTNTSADSKDVVATDFQVMKYRGPEEDPLPTPSVEFFHPNPISQETSLLAVLKGRVGSQEPETLHIKAKATLGIGRENARFNPVAQCAYKYTLDKDPERLKEFFEKWLVAHKKVNPAELEQNPSRKKELEREFATMEIQRCFLTDEGGEPYSYDFVLESVGVLSPYYIVARAIQVLQEKCVKYASIDTGDVPEGLRVTPADARMKGYDFLFDSEDHTLGALLQTWMDLNQIDKGEITYVGYKIPHPLKDQMLLRVGVEDGKELTARQAVAAAARGCLGMFRGWGQGWSALGGTAATPAPTATMRQALQKAATARRFPQT